MDGWMDECKCMTIIISTDHRWLHTHTKVQQGNRQGLDSKETEWQWIIAGDDETDWIK